MGRRLFDNQSVQDAAVRGLDCVAEVFLANDRTGIHHAHEQEIAIGPVGMGQLGANGRALAKELMTTGTVLFEQRVAGVNLTRRGAANRC